MKPGDLVDGRFSLLQPVGSGGMGTVFRATDRSTGQTVAVKLLRVTESAQLRRFEREAELLRDLVHPGIVRYVAHGRADDLEPYLAMEWLEGEDLGHRLTRAGLEPRQAIEVVARAAEALAFAHGRGVIHRDLKPANLYLVGGDAEQVKLLDFGVARLGESARHSTAIGAVLGTPGYMSPEQARGAPDIDARADVFSLGCVLFETLTGRPAFQGAHAVAILAKILLDDPPRLRDVRPDLPPDLDALLARLLAKEPAGRPADAAAVLSALRGLGSGTLPQAAPMSVPAKALTTGERRLLCVIVGRLPGAAAAAAERQTLRWSAAPPPEAASSPTLRSGELAVPLGRILDVVLTHGGRAEQLLDGSVVVTLAGAGVATDQAQAAARCALAIRELLPAAQLALATGRGIVSERWPMGEVIDRATALLETAAGAEGIVLDDVTSHLLGARFSVREGADRRELLGELSEADAGRTLLGRRTAFVGRDRDLSALEALYDECAGEPVARAAIVTAPPGGGKSRLASELLSRLRARHPAPEIWTAQGDPLSAGAAFGLLGQALRSTAGDRPGDGVEARQQALSARLARTIAGEELDRSLEFLAELLGAPFPAERSAQLRAARGDAQLMGDQIRRALDGLLDAECAKGPLVLLIEDLHWGDLPSVRLVDLALRRNRDRPLFVLALARPEVEAQFPGLWAERGAERIRLAPLTRKACEKLLRNALGDAVEPALVERLHELSEGNPLYLEELVRAAAGGKAGERPESVVSMLQARLEALPDEARRLLRAASVFGRVFWAGGVRALLGDGQRASHTSERLAELALLEVVTRRDGSRFPGEEEWAFRHALVVEASHATLTDRDRELGHLLAGEWLERAGETEPLVLAQHFELGGQPALAVEWYARAARQALEGNDLEAAIARAGRGAACGARDVALGGLRLTQAEAHQWRGEHPAALARALEAMAALPSASRPWFQAASEAATAAHRVNDLPRLHELAQALLAAATRPEAAGPFTIAAARLVWGLFTRGLNEEGRALLDAVGDAALRGAGREPAEAAAIELAHATRTMLAGDTGAWLEHEQRVLAHYRDAGDLRHAAEELGHVGYAWLDVGAFEKAAETLGQALAEAERLGLSTTRATALQNLAMAKALLGQLDDGATLARQAIAEFARLGDRRMEGASHDYLAHISMLQGDLETAEGEFGRALAQFADIPPLLARTRANLARLRLLQGRTDEARAAARGASEILAALGQIEEGEMIIRLAEVETAKAAGEETYAREALAIALGRLRERAALIQDPGLRASFLGRVPEHARLLALER
ncbi:MAG: serine/threonine-protein kinase [Myxococcales bacterium]